MQIRKANRIVVAVYLAVAALNIASFAAFDIFRGQQHGAVQRQRTATMEADRFIAGAKSLTNSVRAFAATGDPQHEKAYWNEVRVVKNRDKAEAALRAMGLAPDEIGLIEKARNNSDQLIELEASAFKEGSRGNRAKAIDRVYGEEYRNAQQGIYSPVDQFRERLDKRLANELAKVEHNVRLSWAASVGLALVNVLLVIAILGVFYRRRVVLPLAKMNEQVRDLLAGKSSASLAFPAAAAEIGELAQSFDAYRQTARQVADDQWVKMHQARIAGELQSADSFTELARRFMTEIAPLLQIGHGVFYIHDDERRVLRMLAHYAYRERKELSQTFSYGEGLIGQCALEMAPIVITRPPADYIRIGGGLGEAVPATIMVLPVVSGRRVLAVIEVAGFDTFGSRDQALLDALLPVLAMSMEILERSVKTQRLLNETQEQASQLVQQAEELDAQKRSIAAILEEQNAIFEAVTSGIALVRDHIVMKGNCQLDNIFCTPPGSLIGKTTRGWYPDQATFDKVSASYGRIAGGETVRIEAQMIRCDGCLFWGRLTGRAIDPDDMALGVAWTLEDISDERAAAEAMQQARQLAEEAAKTKSDFLANMSHEIRTPMNAIIGMAHLALKTELNPRQRDYVRKIQQAGQHLLGIINDILDFSKIEAGKLSVERTDFELGKVLENVANLIGEKATSKGLELIFDVAPDVPEALVGDPLRLGQILINYSNNAVKFTETGEIGIIVRKEEESDGDVLLRFGVRDTGIGLTEEQIGRLFQSFSQADTSTSRKYGGTGLGLAISKNLAEAMGGQVGVESEVGQGSTFWFTARLGKSRAEPRRLLPSPDLRGRRMLVVDDNESARTVLSDQLASMSFAVDSVDSGKAAIERVKQAAREGRPYEVVFLDWQMPGMDGAETAVRMRQAGFAPLPHLIMVTAYGREEIIKGAESAGIEDVLIKPVNPSILFDSVIRTLGAEWETDRAAAGLERRGAAIDLSALAGGRILLVEDNDLNQEVAIGLLGDTGCVVEVADNGLIALEKVKQADYDIVLMDMQMPVMDGVTATTEIRKLPQCADLPIVAMTANAMQQDRDRCTAAGMSGHVAKPIDPDELWQALLKWIKPKRATAPVVERPGAGDAAGVAAAESADGLPRHIAGLDVDLGLKRVVGKRPLYLSMLRKFVAGQKCAGDQIGAALAGNDRNTAERLAHTLKGTAGNIGAAELQATAGKLEAAIQANQPHEAMDGLLAASAGQLTALIAALETWLPPDPAMAAAAAVDLSLLGPALARLSALLGDDDSEACKFWDANTDLFKTAFPEHWRGIEGGLHAFDFESALSRLDAAAQARGVEA